MIHEYNEEWPVYIKTEQGRLVIYAINEGGYNSTSVDLLDVINWVKENHPEFLKEEHT